MWLLAVIGVCLLGTPGILNSTEEAVQTDVLVIGAGPSGLAVSAALAGLQPIFEDRPLLDNRIQELCQEIIPQIDWQRSDNPIPLTFDYLRERGLLTFRHNETRKASHIVLTDGEIGGCWNDLEPTLRCLSPAKWMQLPGFPWSRFKGAIARSDQLPSMGEVCAYYKEYAVQMGLSDYIHTHTRVTAVQRIDSVWKVYAMWQGSQVAYEAKQLVVANGNYSFPRRLGIEGEDLGFVTHRLPAEITPNTSVLVVGSGLTAADCVIKALEKGCTVHHLYRMKANKGVDRFDGKHDKYPHYAYLWQLMSRAERDPHYFAHINEQLNQVFDDGRCHINGKEVSVDQVMILIGSESDTSFLPELNAVKVKDVFNKYTYEYSQDLYFVGPLTGDNFVKLNIPGGFAAAHAILNRIMQSSPSSRL